MGRQRARVPNTRRQEALVKYIAQKLVDQPDVVQVSRRVERHTVILELRVAPEDIGRVIGKNGRVAEAIRKLMSTYSQREENIILKIL